MNKRKILGFHGWYNLSSCSPSYLFASFCLIYRDTFQAVDARLAESLDNFSCHCYKEVRWMQNESVLCLGLSIKSDKKGAPVCDIFHQLLRRSKNSWFLEVFVIDWLWVCYENGVIFIRLFLVCLCRNTAILSFFIMNFELANIHSYARKVYSCGDNYYVTW